MPPDVPVLLAAVQFTPIVAFGVGFAIGFALGSAYHYFRTYRKVGVSQIAVVERVGETQPVRAGLIYKARLSTDLAWVAGSLTFSSTDTNFQFAPGDPARLTRSINADQSSQVDILGLRAGEGDLLIEGVNGTGETHDAVTVHITIMAAGTTFLALFQAAARAFNNPAFQGWMNNLLGGVKCDKWADWMAEWIPLHAGDEVCKVEKAVYHPRTLRRLRPVLVRITMCDGTVYYLDPWRWDLDDRNGYLSKADYEREFGEPDEAWEAWSR